MGNYIPPDYPVPKRYEELWYKDFILGVLIGKMYYAEEITITTSSKDEGVIEGGNGDDN